MTRKLPGGRTDAKLGTTPSGKAVWLEKHPTLYKGWSADDHRYAAILHEANHTTRFAEAHRLLAKEKMPAKERLFIGTYPTGIVYADKSRERGGDYLRLAFLPFRSLELEWEKSVTVPDDLRKLILADAKKLQARRGELYQVSSAGQTVRLGG